ncbi:hypothetical protein C8N35_10711 [Breoghania corrubedonensis]|uniref:Uncharacterized protein n=1 Tax=Breoghania corrubedonensis TaxID=665038 RepID=A0A2T5V6C0_9HYPH|nr:hypothetical protein [Breoghania corrubedonensis]PTW59298.1 hypothetical protein C8N35_10711 [Breoghania corrubedonensis]
MKAIIEFYRVRADDTARARVGRVSRSVADTADAIKLARSLLLSLDLPQDPDFIAILDDQENALYCVPVIVGRAFGSTQNAGISVWEKEGGAVDHTPRQECRQPERGIGVTLPIHGDMHSYDACFSQ